MIAPATADSTTTHKGTMPAGTPVSLGITLVNISWVLIVA